MNPTPESRVMDTLAWRRCRNDLATAAAAVLRRELAQGPRITVAIPFDHSSAWAAQTSFLRSVAVSMRNAGHVHAMVLVVNISGEAGERALAPDVRDLAVAVDRDIWQNAEGRATLLNELGVDCVLSLFGPPPEVIATGLVGWIPDFQHFRMPHFFTAQESSARNEVFTDIIQRCDRVLLSSRDAERDCLRFQPEAAGKTRVHPFPSGMVFQPLPKQSMASVVQKYHLPEKFVVVANQFWAHKNHLTVVKAASLLAERGLRVPFVLTGLPSDYRDPANGIVSEVLQAIATGGVRDCVIPLAQVPYADLIQLLRHATLIVQPSSFEGWSTTVQDAKALGRPVACSAIALHREQAPDAVGFFGATKPEELANLLQTEWERLPPGPDLGEEAVAIERERRFARDYGQALWHTCAQAAASARLRSDHA